VADELFIEYDPGAPVGQRLAPEVVAEIEEVAPSAVVNGSITTAKLADKSVTTAKVADGAVGSVQLATKGVKTVNIDDAAVGTAQLADGAVAPAKTGIGVSTARDASGSYVADLTVYLTAAQYAALTPDPNTTYAILG
jgi:hypothetical protein